MIVKKHGRKKRGNGKTLESIPLLHNYPDSPVAIAMHPCTSLPNPALPSTLVSEVPSKVPHTP
jgi:hypothetical protein